SAFAETASNRSLRPVLPSSVCVASITPSNRAATKQPASGFVHQNEYIEWITIFTNCPRDEPKIEGKYCTGGQDRPQLEKLPFFIVRIFVSAASRSFNNDIQRPRLSIKSR